MKGTEFVNMYEEENDPFAQTRKFLLQSATLDDDAPGVLGRVTANRSPAEWKELFDLLTPYQQYYVKILEMGLPPTAGWGCGIERLVMLFSGAKKIADVMPFGTLRSVVAMGTAPATVGAGSKKKSSSRAVTGSDAESGMSSGM